jgi:hypothetical protein
MTINNNHYNFSQLVGFNSFKLTGGNTIDDYSNRDFDYACELKQEVVFLNDKENFNKICFPFNDGENCFSFVVEKDNFNDFCCYCYFTEPDESIEFPLENSFDD